MKKYHCSNCKGIRKHTLLFEVKKSGEEDYGAFQWTQKYKVIECSGCENISFLEVYGDSTMLAGGYDEPHYYEDDVVYPYYLAKGEELRSTFYLPKIIKDIYIETINALKMRAFILTAGGFRAVIEATCNHLKIKKGSLEQRIDLLYKNGYLSLKESKRLHSIRFLGNDALHEIETPKEDQLYIILEIINHLLNNLFISDKMIDGKIDTVIDSYDDFMKLLQNKITSDMLNSEVSVDQIIGKSKRLISKVNLELFKKALAKEINDSEVTFLKVVDEEKMIVTVVAEPDLTLSWL